jgi:hypothetical protein
MTEQVTTNIPFCLGVFWVILDMRILRINSCVDVGDVPKILTQQHNSLLAQISLHVVLANT